jgi:hypothetical protein
MVFLAILLTLVVACASSKEDQARKLHQTQESWQATGRLTTELRQRGALPEKYVRQSLEAMREELDKTIRKAEKLSQ